MADFLNFEVVPFWEVLLRVLLSVGLGLAIGLDRDLKNKPIDFRAYIVVAVTACVIAVMSQELYAEYAGTEKTVTLDFMRIIAGVLTGIGFLGAGAIIRSRDSDRIVGTTTGASIWAAGALGLALGFGFYGITLIAFLTVLGTLVVLGYFMPAITDERDTRKRE